VPQRHLVEGDRKTYVRIDAVLPRLGFVQAEVTFRRRRDGLALTVEFSCPSSDGRPAGRVFRPAAVENPSGKHKVGGRLSALALDAATLLTTDVAVLDQHVTLSGGKEGDA
jgi:hypothetical protein